MNKMRVFESVNGVPIKAWVDGVPFEESAKKQLEQIATLPFIYKHVAVMPDVHTGIGATVGSVIATSGAVIPAAVGVDLGCGVISVKTNLKASDLPDSLEKMRWAIEKDIPHGRTDNGGRNDRGAWGNVPQITEIAWMGLEAKFKQIIKKHPKIKDSNSARHLGTLGTGNHFIEVCLDENQDVWIMLHSGSRGVGGKIGSYFIELAKEDMRKWFINLPDKNLAYLPEGTEHFTDYVEAVEWAQNFAVINREIMLQLTIDAMAKVLNRKVEKSFEIVNCFASETRIITYNGIYEIGQLVNTNQKILTSGGKWIKAPIKSFGKQKIYELIVSRCGRKKSIFTTAKHLWIITPTQRLYTIEKTTDNLLKGDRLACQFRKRPQNLKIDKKAAARGFVFGDGFMNDFSSYANFCGNKDNELIKLFKNIGGPLRVYSQSKRINSLPREWKNKLPSFNKSLNFLYGWLAGYFAADGDVDATGHPTLSSAKKENLEFVKVICNRLGIGTFGIRTNYRKGFGKEKTNLYLMGLMRRDLCNSFFLLSNHRTRFIKGKYAAERRHWTVLSVKETNRIEEVFCAVVKKTHSFVLDDNILTKNCHHNYIARENHFGKNVIVTRKGAVRAREGDWTITPGSMGTRSYIGLGKGNPISFKSCSHGAGRRMSRTEAKKTFTIQDHEKAVQGVECRRDADVIDETPGAYKNIDQVMNAQQDLVEIVYTLKQILCVKG